MERLPRYLVALAAMALLLVGCGTRIDKQAFTRSLRGSEAGSGAVATPANAGGSSVSNGSQVLGTTQRSDAPSVSRTARPRTASIPEGVSKALVGDVIRVGIHVPITGAAPLPANFLDSLEVVEAYTRDNPIHGRTVEFVIEDDGYDPARGLAACRKLAGENVLFVIGHTMPTVQDGCAGLFDTRLIPYLMRGTPESYLDGRPAPLLHSRMGA